MKAEEKSLCADIRATIHTKEFADAEEEGKKQTAHNIKKAISRFSKHLKSNMAKHISSLGELN